MTHALVLVTTCASCGVSSLTVDVLDRGGERLCDDCYDDALGIFDDPDDDYEDDEPDPFECRHCGAANADSICACEP